MTTNRDRIGKMNELVEAGALPFVNEHMKKKFGTHWRQHARVPNSLAPKADLDAHALLYIVMNNWRDVFQHHLKPEIRDAASAAFAGRNKYSHSSGAIDDNITLRALSGAHELLVGMYAKPQAEAAKALFDGLQNDMVRRRLEAEGKLKKPAAAEDKPAAPAVTKKTEEEKQPDFLGGGRVEGLTPWRIACPPRDDVLEGRLNKDAFAANLAAAARGEGSETYKDSRAFFNATHLTHGLELTLGNAAKRLGGGGGPSTIGLQTNFGGGKTHTLLSLLHMARLGDPASVEALASMRAQFDGLSLGNVKTAVFVGTDKGPDVPLDTVDGRPVRTLWGYLAHSLAGREGLSIIEAAEAAGTNPGGEAFKRVLDAAGGPSLILLDELVAYVRQLDNERYEAHLSFIQSMTEAAAQSDNALIVGSLPESDIEAGGGEKGLDTLRRLEKLFGRTQSSWQPAQGSETYAVIRRRLFQELDDNGEKARKRTVEAFRKIYRDNKGDFPAGTAEKDYEEKLLEAYPVHPMLFDKLSSEWGGLDKFQRTRGVLSLMARTIYASYREGRDDPLILPSSLQIDDPEVRGALIEPLDSPAWGSIVDAEVDGDRSLPVRIEMSRTRYREKRIASRASRAVFVCTAPQGDARGGLTGPELRLACVQPGDQVSIFGDALRELSEQSSYLYEAEGRYWFGSKPTLNKLAANRAGDVDADQIDAEIVKALQEDERARGQWSGVHTAPYPPQDVEDRPATRLVILGPDTPYSQGDASAAYLAALDAVSRRAGGQRRFRNALVFLAADERQLEEVRKTMRRALAWKGISEDRALDLTESQKQDAASRAAEAMKGARQAIRKAWSHLLSPEPSPDGGAALMLDRTGLRPTGQRSPAEAAWDKAQEADFVISRLGKASLTDRLRDLWSDEQPHLSVDQVKDWFFEFPYMERLRDDQVLADALADALVDLDERNVAFGIASAAQDGKYSDLKFNQSAVVRFGSGQLLVRREVAETQLQAAQPASEAGDEGGAQPGRPSAPGGVKEPEKARPTRFTGTISLDALRGASKAGLIFNDVIGELDSADGVDLKITLEITATSRSGFPEDVEEIVRDNAKDLGFDTQRFD
jgi:Protein of unknown function (DUF499)/Swt1-like HEPN